MKFLELIRWKNLVIIGLTQIVFLFPILFDTPEPIYRAIWLILATLLTAAAGYIINDYYDTEADKINKPNKLFIGKYIQKPDSRRLYFVFVILSLWFGYYALKEDTKIILSLHILLFLYSYKLKRLPLIGNIVVSLCSAATIWIVGNEISYNDHLVLILVYSFFAFGLTMIRELIKDVEDIEGDKHSGYRTLAILLPLKWNKGIIAALILSTTILFSYFLSLSDNKPSTLLRIITGIVIDSSLLILFFQTIKAKTKDEFSKLSSYSKAVMLLGLLSVLLFY